MQKILTQLPAIKLVGINARTNNDHISESTPIANKIAETVMKYFNGALAGRIPNRKRPYVTYCVYADYESDCRGLHLLHW